MSTEASSPLLRIRGLAKRYPVRSNLMGRPTSWLHAVDGVDLDIQAGETFALVGETGSGKSTLSQVILRLTPASAGEIVFDGIDVLRAGRAELTRLRRRMQIVFQDPFSSLDPRMRIDAIVMEGMYRLGLSHAQQMERVQHVLETVGLSARLAEAYPHQLSGGQRQRVALARALAVEPQFLLLDEPVSALDVSMQSQILNLLRELQQRLELTYLFISHDLSVVRHVADRVGVMYLGRLVEVAPTEELFAQPRHPYTRALLSAIPEGQRTATTSQSGTSRIVLRGETTSPIDPPAYCRFANRCFRALERCRVEDPALQATQAHGHLVACFNPCGRNERS